MSQNILADYSLLINHQIDAQEVLLGYHLKVEAMLEVLLGSHLPSYSKITIHHYLWAVSDIIEQAKNLNEQLLRVLMRKMAEVKR